VSRKCLFRLSLQRVFRNTVHYDKCLALVKVVMCEETQLGFRIKSLLLMSYFNQVGMYLRTVVNLTQNWMFNEKSFGRFSNCYIQTHGQTDNMATLLNAFCSFSLPTRQKLRDLCNTVKVVKSGRQRRLGMWLGYRIQIMDTGFWWGNVLLIDWEGEEKWVEGPRIVCDVEFLS
jgi:hypothetical protein